ncbi:MAG: hypothetical protein P8H39_01525 [Thalassotalea sp.]|nr:hypothetical protein [Thalassotalea sp.]
MFKKSISLLLSITLLGCSTTYPNKTNLSGPFPSVSGESLEQNKVVIPEHFKGEQTLLLIGYVQNSQFDIDRWLIGLDMTQTNVAVYELPTMSGMFPKMFKTVIDNGMRKGIPKEIWKGVITIYDGEPIKEFTGNENPSNARVIMLNKQGEVIYFYDRGFSTIALNEVRALTLK